VKATESYFCRPVDEFELVIADINKNRFVMDAASPLVVACLSGVVSAGDQRTLTQGQACLSHPLKKG
jgi:hypothetical protein